MSKYIIELGEDANMVQAISVTQNGNVYIDSTAYVEYLEQLNSDYINEHFGQLQDEAYQKGLNDAWECGKKLAWTAKYGGYGERLNDVFGRDDTFDFYDYTPNEAIEKLKAFEQKQDKIEVGDEVKHKSDRVAWTAIVTRICCGTLTLMEHSGASADNYPIDDFVKTGRHFDIASILEAMKHD